MPPSSGVEFVAWGQPIAQGSMSAYPLFDKHRQRWRCRLTHKDPKAIKAWRKIVSEAAVRAMNDAGLSEPWAEAMDIRVLFTVPRPRTVTRAKRRYPDVPPDGDKLLRALWDPLKAILVDDDDRFVDFRVQTRYVGEEGGLSAPGARVWAKPMITGADQLPLGKDAA